MSPAPERRSYRTRYTSVGRGQAAWRIVGNSIEILALTVTSAVRPPDTVAFDNDGCHDLCWARERFGKFADLWDAIRSEYWQLLFRSDPHFT
ncbi:hypothetical protein ACFRAQ_18535 [Nocardia sp. NPDC056611]|uniref:hypothetical protein n=1 Tax=Nocardia sp. NPDC056611 TaxID=3345877 RepID=UPI00366FC051